MNMYEHERQVQIHKNEGFTVLSNGFIRDNMGFVDIVMVM